jgi:hypothetical protein
VSLTIKSDAILFLELCLIGLCCSPDTGMGFSPFRWVWVMGYRDLWGFPAHSITNIGCIGPKSMGYEEVWVISAMS